MTKLLLHICCGPCAITCVERLQREGYDITGFFYNPNIHPGQEYLRRREGAREVAVRMGIPLLFAKEDALQREYDAEAYFRAVTFKENNRCLFCYKLRLKELVQKARESGFELVSTSLLYSRYQKHDSIRTIGESLCAGSDVNFYYADFRAGWSRGITLSKRWNIYRQQYCGCIFSEAERYLTNEDSDLAKGTSGC